MPQIAALNALITQTPFDHLIGGVYSTIWIRKTSAGIAVSGRRKADEAVISVPCAGAQFLLNELDSVLSNGESADVQVGGAAYGITKMDIVGGTEHVMTEHERIRPEARGEPTLVV